MKPQKEMTFEFQEIPLEEAQNVVLAGDGNYAGVKQSLLDKLPLLPDNKAFAFGLPDGQEVPEEARRGLCHAINGCLNRAKLSWKITYSGTRKLFICVPKLPKNPGLPRRSYKKREVVLPAASKRGKHGLRPDVKVILQLDQEGMKNAAIAEKLGINIKRVANVLYYARHMKGYKS